MGLVPEGGRPKSFCNSEGSLDRLVGVLGSVQDTAGHQHKGCVYHPQQLTKTESPISTPGPPILLCKITLAG